MKCLAVDHGNVRIGLAVSDPTGQLARPLQIIRHVSRGEDARKVAEIACEQAAGAIIVGLPLDADGQVGPRARSVLRFVVELESATALPVLTWDESHSTAKTEELSIARGQSAKRRRGSMDDEAAAVILQDFLDYQPGGPSA